MSSKILNTGGVLPVYADIKHQQKYQISHAGYEIVARNDYFLPFWIELSGAAQAVTRFALINADDGTTYEIPTGNIVRAETPSSAETFYIYEADTDLALSATCGNYYFKIVINGVSYVTDIMDVRDICDAETAGIAFDSCLAGVFTFDVNDTLDSSVDYERVEEYKQQTKGWSELTITANQFNVDSSGVGQDTLRRLIRRTVQTACGNTLQVEYMLTFGDPDPCGGYTLDVVRYNNTYPNENLWKVEFTNTNSIDRIPYELPFTQFFYIEMFPAVPEPEREQEILINGEGEEVSVSGLTKEKLSFSIRNIPHQLLYVFTALNDLDTVTITRTCDGLSYTGLSEIEFSSDGKVFQSDGELKFKARKQYASGCDENMTLTTV